MTRFAAGLLAIVAGLFVTSESVWTTRPPGALTMIGMLLIVVGGYWMAFGKPPTA